MTPAPQRTRETSRSGSIMKAMGAKDHRVRLIDRERVTGPIPCSTPRGEAGCLAPGRTRGNRGGDQRYADVGGTLRPARSAARSSSPRGRFRRGTTSPRPGSTSSPTDRRSYRPYGAETGPAGSPGSPRNPPPSGTPGHISDGVRGDEGAAPRAGPPDPWAGHGRLPRHRRTGTARVTPRRSHDSRDTDAGRARRREDRPDSLRDRPGRADRPADPVRPHRANVPGRRAGAGPPPCRGHRLSGDGDQRLRRRRADHGPPPL